MRMERERKEDGEHLFALWPGGLSHQLTHSIISYNFLPSQREREKSSRHLNPFSLSIHLLLIISYRFAWHFSLSLCQGSSLVVESEKSFLTIFFNFLPFSPFIHFPLSLFDPLSSYINEQINNSYLKRIFFSKNFSFIIFLHPSLLHIFLSV